MAAFVALLRNKDSIEDKFYAAVRAAQDERQREYDAAVLIQSVWRRELVLQESSRLSKNATKIQSIVRRFQAQMQFRCLLTETRHEKRVKRFNDMATLIQKTWRGYYSRRTVFDHDKYRQYQVEVTAANEEMRRQLADYNAATAEEEMYQQYERDKAAAVKKALHSHHLVSTANIPSIFQPPGSSKNAAAMPPIEHFIRSVNKARLVIPSLKGR